MKTSRLAWTWVLLAGLAGCAHAPPAAERSTLDRGCLEGALAERFGLDSEQRDEALRDVELEPGTPTTVRYTRMLGDGGWESCRAQYDTSRGLTELSCDYRYVSHSMGPANVDTRMEVRREYGGGELAVVSGTVVQRSVDSGRTTRRAITSPDDDALERLEPPLLQIPDACVLR